MARGVKTGGRQKGTSNKLTADLRAMIEGALHDAGGRKYLAKQAKDNPAAFLSLVGRCVPKDIQVTGSLTLTDLIQQAAQPKVNGHAVETDPSDPAHP